MSILYFLCQTVATGLDWKDVAIAAMGILGAVAGWLLKNLMAKVSLMSDTQIKKHEEFQHRFLALEKGDRTSNPNRDTNPNVD